MGRHVEVDEAGFGRDYTRFARQSDTRTPLIDAPKRSF
jgi:hypothetical protein